MDLSLSGLHFLHCVVTNAMILPCFYLGSTGPTQVSTGVSMNLPLPGENGPVALVKLYDGLADTIKLNDVLEVYGVISTDPSLALLGANE